MTDLFDVIHRKQLRAYQVDALDRLRSSLRRGNRRVVLCLPTGGGKTLIAANIIAGALRKGGRAVFTAPMLSLIDQTVAAFRAEGMRDLGVMQSKHPLTNPDMPVQVCSVQTLDKRGLPDASIVMVDEAHVGSRVISRWMNARPDLVFIGLSATPGRRGMAEEWQDLVVVATTRELIDLGYLSQFRVFAPSAPDMTGVRIVQGDFETKGSGERMADATLTADIVSNYLSHGEDRPTLAFAVDVAHAKRMAADFTDAGVHSAFVEAATDTIERRVIQQRFRKGEIRVIWSVRTMSSGVDLPVSGIIDAAPTRSAMLHQQKLGRGLRVNSGTEDLVIWDHAGNTERVGFLTDLDWSRLLPGKEPAEPKKREPLPKCCKQCSLVMPPKVRECPACGFEAPLPTGWRETADGDLVEVAIEGRKPAGKREFTLAEKQVWYSALIAIAQDRGHKPGSAYHRFKEKFGVSPSTQLEATAGPVPYEVRAWVKSRQIAYAKAREASRAA